VGSIASKINLRITKMGKSKKTISRLKKKSKPKHKKRSAPSLSRSIPEIHSIYRPPVADIEPPPGFRTEETLRQWWNLVHQCLTYYRIIFLML
jgi:hypothetical protein